MGWAVAKNHNLVRAVEGEEEDITFPGIMMTRKYSNAIILLEWNRVGLSHGCDVLRGMDVCDRMHVMLLQAVQ